MEPLLISRRDSATMLGISLRTLDKLVQEKRLPVQRVRSRVLISRRALEKFVESSRATAGA